MIDQKSFFYMCLLSLQFGMQPTLTRSYTPKDICRSTVILVQEILKLFFAYMMLTISGSKKSALSGKSQNTNLFLRRINLTSLLYSGWNPSTWVRVAFVPAGLYALQNIAALKAYQNLDALTFNVLNREFWHIVRGDRFSPP
jgi:UDP-sugar transporter A1/2/3